MPPSHTRIHSRGTFDGNSFIDFREYGISAVYYPNYFTSSSAHIFDIVSQCLWRKSYIGNYGRVITPARGTWASVPERPFYRYKGKNLERPQIPEYDAIISDLIDKLPDDITVKPNSSISNGYEYNSKDTISPHTDDEKFLCLNNPTLFPDQAQSVVCTYTFLNAGGDPMEYQLADPNTGIGYGLLCRNGSLLLQGSVLHSVLPKRSTSGLTSAIPDQYDRISITLRTLDDSCPCRKISCPYIYGPSNYIYYNIGQ